MNQSCCMHDAGGCGVGQGCWARLLRFIQTSHARAHRTHFARNLGLGALDLCETSKPMATLQTLCCCCTACSRLFRRPQKWVLVSATCGNLWQHVATCGSTCCVMLQDFDMPESVGSTQVDFSQSSAAPESLLCQPTPSHLGHSPCSPTEKKIGKDMM